MQLWQVLKAGLLIVLSASILGCMTAPVPEVVTIKPVCSAFPLQGLERVTVKELKLVEDETYRKLRDNEQALLHWGRTNEKIISEICESPD